MKYSLNDYFNLSAGRYHTGIVCIHTAIITARGFRPPRNRPFLFALKAGAGFFRSTTSASQRRPHSFGALWAALRWPRSATVARRARQRPGRCRPRDENNGQSFNLGIFAVLTRCQTANRIFRLPRHDDAQWRRRRSGKPLWRHISFTRDTR